ncbi:MAG: type I methionyl aminopeptidase [Thermodesulfobacteriota bacterium]
MKRDKITLKSSGEIEKLRESNVHVAEVLQILTKEIKPGITTADLERIAEREAARRKVRPAFKGYKGYPYCLCTSVNSQIVHGMPGKRELKDGDIVSIDFGVELNGYYGDSAVTVPVGTITKEAERLLRITKESLERAINAARAGNQLSEISAAVEQCVEQDGFSVVRAFVGHGIGTELHELPQVPNFVMPGLTVELKEGMVLAIEPMVNAGSADIDVLDDGWTAVTQDGELSAHFEHSVAITADGPYVLSRV